MRALLASLLLCSSCTCNLLPDPESRAASLPESADVAVGATHDLLVVACQDRVTLLDAVFPVAATALFVGFGRLDAAFYLPGAVVNSTIPKCKAIDYSVSAAALEGTAFELEATENPKAFKLHARSEGESTFTALVSAGGQDVEVVSTLRAWRPDRVALSVNCQAEWPTSSAQGQLAGWVPAGGTAWFQHQLFHGDTRLSGYGYLGVQSPRLAFSESRGSVSAQVSPERGPFTVTSEVVPSFSLQLTSYDASDFDHVSFERVTNEVLFEGATTTVRATATIQGKSPCVDGFPRVVKVETPTVCRFARDGDATQVFDTTNTPLSVELLSVGTCRLSMTLPGTNFTQALELPVFRGFEAIALPTTAISPALHHLGLWGAGPGDLWIIGWKDDVAGQIKGTALQWRNGAWGSLTTMRPPRSLRAISGDRASGTAYAVGGGGGVARLTGTSWAAIDAGTGEDLNDVWVGAPNDVYVVGDNGTLRHFDGAEWSALDAGVGADLQGVWGDGAGTVYVVGSRGIAKRSDGASFTDVFPAFAGDAGFNPGHVSGSGPNDAWVLTSSAGLHWNGASWATERFGLGTGMQLAKIWSVGDGFSYALVRIGPGSALPTAAMVRFDGTRSIAIPVPRDARAITGIGNDVYVLTATELLRYRHDPSDVFP